VRGLRRQGGPSYCSGSLMPRAKLSVTVIAVTQPERRLLERALENY